MSSPAAGPGGALVDEMGSTVSRAARAGGRRSRRAAQAAGWVAAAALLAQASVGWLPTQLVPAAESSTSVRLVDDRAGGALFTSTGLVPGQVEQRCVALAVTGSAQSFGGVDLSAVVPRADLAPYLSLTVERGVLADPTRCDTFSGQQVWTGTLAQLPGTPATGVSTGWQPGVDQRAVFRFSVGVLDDPGAQGLTARASFVWSLDVTPVPAPVVVAEPTPVPAPAPVPAVVPAPVPSATPVPAPPAVPTARPVPVPAPVRTSAAVPAPAVPPAPSAEPAPSVGPAAPATRTGSVPGSFPRRGGTSGDVLLAPPIDTTPSSFVEVAAAMAQVAFAVADDSQFPLALVAVVIGFVAVQGRLDRRDPKLALAPVRHDLSGFPDFPESPRRAPS
ncbi:hypothetical protein GCU67_11680 [Modestobacter muralis]|uniref:Uncharacterized protein n=1 Tax=Modestobacter muralis TaxID=1608614 RepID=A0A6P0EUY2_9ACTN|nr:hypothetical protein [Modestobacter muralis]NEK94825.1 hypothetical protein [Modestobacter muralis]NEN51713.1 hypothetical protein [Modestobacter muralis]